MTHRGFSLLVFALAASLLLSACVAPAPLVSNAPVPAAGEQPAATEVEPAAAAAEPTQVTPPGRGPGYGMQGSMMARHHAQIPEPYAGLASPVAADEGSLARGQALYAANCASCHGDTGMGETELGQSLDPPVAPIAHTSRMLSDGYLFWRISEGGVPFGTAMPACGDALEEAARWDVINYVRSLETGGGMGRGPGPRAGVQGEAEHRAEMLATAQEQGVITAEEAELFERVHAVLDTLYPTGGMEGMGAGGMMAMQRALTDQAVRDGHISQADADSFTEIHDRLIDAGVMQ